MKITVYDSYKNKKEFEAIEGKTALACACQVRDNMVVNIWPMQGVRLKKEWS